MADNNQATKLKKRPSWMFSFIILVLVASLAVFPYVFWNVNMAATFFLGFLIVIPACMYLGYTYEEIEQMIIEYCKKVTMTFFVILACGGLIGTWIACGAVPATVYYGLKVINPNFFLLFAFIIPFLYAFITETSWGSMGTVGIAMMAVGAGLGANPAMTAGAIVSGAFLGDGWTPISDTLLVNTAVTEVKPMDFFKKLSKIALPAFVLTCIFYIALGFMASGAKGTGDYSQVNLVMDSMQAHFKISIIPFLPCILVIIMLAKGKPSVITLLLGSLTAGIVAVLYQGASVPDVLNAFWGGYKLTSGVALIDSLLSRGGITSMFSTTGLYMISFALIGMMNRVGIIEEVVRPILGKIKGRMGLALSTISMAFIGNAVGCSGNFSYLFTGTIMLPSYKKFGLKNMECARAMGCSVTPMGPLIPWNMNAVIALQYFGVSSLQYGPFFFIAFIMPILYILAVIFKFDISEYSQEELRAMETAGA